VRTYRDSPAPEGPAWRRACVDIRALPLQVLLRAHAEWQGKPVVVVDHDKPQGVILWSNRQAQARRILPGMRYAAGLSIARDLRGGEVSDAVIAEAREQIVQCLWQFSPRIEPSEHEPGVYWLDASGLRILYPSLSGWASQLRDALRELQLQAIVAVGYTRFGAYAAAKSSTRNVIFQSPAQERAHVRRVPVERLSLPPTLRQNLEKLGVETLGRFAALPAGGIRRRFGPEGEELHRLAHEEWAPLNAADLREPVEVAIGLDWPETNSDRLLGVVAQLLPRVLETLREYHESLETLRITLALDDNATLQEEVQPAEPTLEAGAILPLVRLRLEQLSLSAGVVEVTLRAEGAGTVVAQLELFRETTRDTDAAERAFAVLRAELGNHAVASAKVVDAHLPEARFLWEPMQTLPKPRPRALPMRPLVRRIHTPARELPPSDRREPDGWLIAGLREGPVDEVLGPYVISGGWWLKEVQRAYHYVRTRSGRWLWIYHDHRRRRWFLHGEAE